MCRKHLEQVGAELFRAARSSEDLGYPSIEAVDGIMEIWSVSTTPVGRADPGIAAVAAGYARAKFEWIVSEQ